MSRKSSYQNLKYDTYGRSLQKKSGGGILRFLFGFLVPYIVINGIIFLLVTASPSVEVSDPNTTDYKTATVSIKPGGLLPLKNLTATLEGEPIELTKDGSDYTAILDDNGTLTVTATSVNGMIKTCRTQVNLLDETPPVIDEDSVNLGAGYIEFTVSDNQSGVDFDSIYAIDGDGDNIRPTDVNKSTGTVMFSMKTDTLQVYVKDLAGNEVPATFSVN